MSATRDTAVRYVHVEGGVYERGDAKVRDYLALLIRDETLGQAIRIRQRDEMATANFL
jgi:hypothetical protein